MNILAIDTSCDDTCIAILKTKNQKPKILDFEILSNIVSSQTKIHAKYGGVYPFLAKREHQRNLPIVLRKALKGAKLLLEKIDLIAVTVGPGLEPCLWTGINFAENLAKKLKLPLIPVNHIEAHIFANWLNSKFNPPPRFGGGQNSKLFPAVCLVVSGGHTQLILMSCLGNYKIIGETRDDAAGECLDKTARILGLGYPGGPAIAAEATKFKVQSLKFKVGLPRPMIHQKNYDFSFSGLKTAVLYQYQKSKIKNQKYKQAMASEVQQAIIDVLIKKTIRAVKEYKAKSIILGGGVASNKELRRQFNLQLITYNLQLKFFVPQKKFCTDNAAMVGAAGYFQRKSREIKAMANLALGQKI